MACSAVVWTTGSLEDKMPFFSSYPNRSGNLIAGGLIADRNVILHFQMNFSLSSISSLVKEGRSGTSQLSPSEYDQVNYSSCLNPACNVAHCARSIFSERNISERWPGKERTNGHSLVSLEDNSKVVYEALFQTQLACVNVRSGYA